MKQKLIKLAESLSHTEPASAAKIYKLAGRFDKVKVRPPIKSQKAYKYILYLKFFRGIDDALFHRLKRSYLHGSPDIQKECDEELKKLVSQDAAEQKIPSSTIWNNLKNEIAKLESDQELWDSYFKRELGKRSD